MIAPPRILEHENGSSGDSNLARNGGYDAAIGCLQYLSCDCPAFTIAWRAEGVALHNPGRYEEAIDCDNNALRARSGKCRGPGPLGERGFRGLGRSVETSGCYTRVGEVETRDMSRDNGRTALSATYLGCINSPEEEKRG
jgi:hypothetical protein